MTKYNVVKPNGQTYMTAELVSDMVHFKFAAHTLTITFDKKVLPQLIPILQQIEKTMEKPNRFDFEQQILDCWGIIDDLQVLLSGVDSESLDEDELQNYIIGLKTIYQLKFQQLFETFEGLVYTNQV